jgi:hypothetical protein
MASNQKTDADARRLRAEERLVDAAKAQNEAAAEAKRVEANTLRLRALRLAKEAADLEAALAAPAKKPKKSAKNRTKAIPVEALNASNDK